MARKTQLAMMIRMEAFSNLRADGRGGAVIGEGEWRRA